MREWIGPGTFLGDYEVVSRIEHEVFLVRAENGTPATLKLLGENLVWEPANLQRFIKAIKAAPPLDHRNICRTFDAGATQSGRPFVVSELIHGRPLDALEIGLLRSLTERLELASQIADAVAAAHASGVLHLDLTPDKVLVEYDRQIKDANWINEYEHNLEESRVAINFTGRVRVLDFAVMMAAVGASVKRDAYTLQPYTTLETLPYCSPEWVSGEPLTTQSDIFSLGVLVYELLTGTRPFKGETVAEIRWAIFTEEPQQLTDFVPKLNPAINRAVLKALAKDPDQRFRTAAEFSRALRGLVQTETESELQRATAAANQARSFKLRWQRFWPQALDFVRVNWRRGVAGAIVLFELFFIAAILIHSRRGAVEEMPSDGPREKLPLTRVTHHGKVREAVLTPDAKALVYLIEEPERQSLLFKPYNQKTGDGKSLPEILLVTSKTAQLSGLSVAPGGDFAYYLSTVPGNAAELLRVPVSGGPVQTVLPEVASAVGFAPDRKQFAFARQQSGEAQIITASVNGADTTILASWPAPTNLASVAPAWSRDGKQLACAIRRADNDLTDDVMLLDVGSGKQRTLAAGQWAEVYGLGWLPGDQGLLVNGRALGQATGQLWRVSLLAGELTALTKGLDDYCGLSFSSDGSRLLTVYTEHKAELWLGLDEQAQRSLTTTNIEAHSGFTWLNDKQIVYAAYTPGGMELREITTDGQPAKLFRKLAPGMFVQSFAPGSTPETSNASVIFAASQNQQTSIWQGGPGDTALQSLAATPLALWPSVTQSGHSLLYSNLVKGRAGLEIKDTTNARPDRQLEQRAWGGVLSPNGELVAANTFNEKLGRWQLSIWPLNGGHPLPTFDLQTFDLSGDTPRRLRWTPDGSALVYSVFAQGSENLWQQPLVGGAPVPLTKLTKRRIYDFAWSPSGQQIAVLRGEPHGEAYLLDTTKLKN